jgi:hypothetical protein
MGEWIAEEEGMGTRWTLKDAMREGFLLAYLAQEAERGITAENAADVEKAIAALRLSPLPNATAAFATEH